MKIQTIGMSDEMLDVSQIGVKLRDVQWIRGEQGIKIEQQFSASFSLIVLCSGSGKLVLDDKERHLRAEKVYICKPQQTYGIKAVKEGIEFYLFRFDIYRDMKRSRNKLRVINEEVSFFPTNEISIRAKGMLLIQCVNVYKNWCMREAISKFRSQIDFMEVIHSIMLSTEKSPERNSSQSLAVTKEYMEGHYYENVTIEQLASMASLSSKYYVDLYKKTYGISAMEYLSRIRIKQAKRLMLQSGVKIRDIAGQVGYHDEFYFSRKFKKQVGVSPKDYIKSRRRKIAAYGHAAIGHLLSLNIMPFAAPLHPKWTRYYYEHYHDDIPVCLSAYLRNIDWEANVEKLLDSTPDIVIASGKMYEQERERIKQGVPCFFAPKEEADWREQLCSVADVLGETAEAKLCLEDYDYKVSQALKQLVPYDKEIVLVIRLLKQQIYAHCNRSMKEVLYGDLQRKPWDLTMQTKDTPLQIEQLGEMKVDRILVLVCQEAETLSYWRELQADIRWQQITAVREGKAHMIYSDIWREYSIYAHRRAIDDTLALYSGKSP